MLKALLSLDVGFPIIISLKKPLVRKTVPNNQGERDEENVPDECLGSTYCMIDIYFLCQ